jgi:hypothetical protein
MWYHHVGAIILFIFLFLEKGLYCVNTTIPFILHQIYWISGAESLNLLGIYNLSFAVSGLSSIYLIRKKRKEIRLIVPIMCMLIVSVNYFIYCYTFDGLFCPPTAYITGNYMYDSIIHSLLLFTTCIGAALLIAEY